MAQKPMTENECSLYYFRTAIATSFLFGAFFIFVLYYAFPTIPTIIYQPSTTPRNIIAASTDNDPDTIHTNTYSQSGNRRHDLIKYNSQDFDGEPYHDPQSRCDLPVDRFKNHSEVQYYNEFPEDMTIEQVIAKRIEPVENIPMCQGADGKNFNQYQDILNKLPTNYIAYAGRCQINSIGRGRRQFGGLLSGDPLQTHHSTQVGFLHVYKAGNYLIFNISTSSNKHLIFV